MTRDPRPDNTTRDPAPSLTAAKYQAAVQTAVVAGVFSAIVAAVLLYDFAGRGPDVPLETKEYQALKTELARQPNDEEIKGQLRQLDVELRRSYFHQRRFTHIGAWLLLGGVVVLLIAAKTARTLRPELPMPQPPPTPYDPEIRTTALARWSVAVLGFLVLAAGAWLIRDLPTRLPKPDELAVSNPPPVTPVIPAKLVPSPPPVSPAVPKDDQLASAWPRFRGPGGQGISTCKDVPTAWDAASGEGIVWKTPVPLVGNNSPVVWGDRVFLSGATEEKREVYCFDATSGKLVWQKEVPPDPNAPDEPLEVMEDTGFAAPTMATDGLRVYAILATGDVAAFDFDGNPVWQKSLGRPKNAYGYAASLTTYGGQLFIQFDQGSPREKLSKMIALDSSTGETAWETPRDVANSWPTPIVIELEDGSHQLVTASDPWVIAYDPADGREIWRSKSLMGDVGPSPAFADGVLYVTCETAYLTAIRVDASAKGDITETNKLWEGEDGLPDTASPLATKDFVFLAASYGILTCYDAKSGEILWDEEFDDSTFTSSPSMAGGLLYLFTEEGKAWILKPSREGCQRVGEPDLGEKCVTSPAFQDGRIYIRGAAHLICLGEKKEAQSSMASAGPASDEKMLAAWPRFRGPGGQGISACKNVPTVWDAASGEGIVWKTPVPLAGNNSPVVWGDRVFLSGATEEKREVYCFDATSGKLLWQKEVPPDPNAPDEPLEVMEDTGFAAPTMATDGLRVYAIFATGDVAAFDLDGNPVWQKSLGRPKNAYGYAASLTTYGGRLFIQFDQGSPREKLSKMIALDGATGETAWETPRDVANSWPTPIAIELEDGSHQLVTASDPWVIAYDPADGREIWRSKSLMGDVGPSPAFADGILYVTCETAYLTAIRVDASAKGDITETNKLWEGEDGLPDTASPLATKDFVFLVASYGILTCYDAKSGEILWDEEFDDSTFTSSPSMAGGLLYLFTEEGKAWILKPSRDGCQRVGEPDLGEKCVTSPAFQDGRIYIRGVAHLLALGSPAPNSELPAPDSPND